MKINDNNAADKGELIVTGPYAYISHPQYLGLFIVMIGMLIKWPAITTALMSPVLVFVYYQFVEEGIK